MTLENNRTPLLYYTKLCASFQSHGWIQTEATVRKGSIRVTIGDYLSHVTFKFDGWPWKTIEHLFYTTSSCMHHFKAIQSGNAQFGSKFFVPCDLEIWRMTLKTTGHLFYFASSFVHHFIAISEFKLELQSGNSQFGSKSTYFFEPCDLEIWRMTLKNNRAPLQCYFKLCGSLCSHWWIQTGITVRKRLTWVKIHDFLAVWPWNLTDDLEKIIEHLFCATSSSVHHFIIICEFKLELRLSWVLTSVTLTFDLWPWSFAWTSLLSLVITPKNFMMKRWWEHNEKVWQKDGHLYCVFDISIRWSKILYTYICMYVYGCYIYIYIYVYIIPCYWLCSLALWFVDTGSEYLRSFP